MPPQQVTIGPTPMKGVEIDRERNCYACEGFEHIA